MSKINIPWGWFLGIAICGSSIWSTNCAFAQIIPDGTLPNNSSVKLEENNSIIEGGTQAGGNLFHSFREFSVPINGAALFNNAADIQNIISRVTGGSVSNIDGLIYANGTANLFLINPNGIVFGQNAQLNVGGSFVASTANALQFGNLGFFSATEKNIPSPLLTINPSALLFNQINQNAAIQNNSVAFAGYDPAGLNAFGLRVPDGKSLLLVGGNVSIDGGELNAFGGRVELGGLGEPGTVGLGVDADNLSLRFPDNVARTEVSLTNQAGIYVKGAGGGNIAVNASNLEILGGSFLSGGIGEGLGTSETIGGDITLNATGSIKVAGGSIVRNPVRLGSLGNGGNITIDSGSFSLSDGAQLQTLTYGQGDAGNVTVSAKNAVDLLANAAIFSTVEAGGVGKGGNININAATVSLIDGAQLQTLTRGASDTQLAGRGDAGNVNVNVTGSVNIAGQKNGSVSAISSSMQTGTVGNGGNITIDSGSFSLSDGAILEASTSGQGNAGNVTVQALDAVSLANGKILSTVNEGGMGEGGNIDINAVTLSLKDAAQLLTITRGASATQPGGRGDAGNVNVNVTGIVNIAGEKNGYPSGIGSSVETGTVGNGGNITINSGSFSLRDRAQLVASTSGLGNAGNVTVSAKNAVDLADANIFSTVDAGGVGKGGNIDINAATLSLIDSAQLLTATSGASNTQPAGRGDAGNVNVNVTGIVNIAGEKNGLASGIRSLVETGTVGNGGNITIDSGSFSLRDGAQLVASTSGLGNAGNVTVRALNAVFLTGSNASIFSTVEAGGVGKGGNIDINAATLSLIDGAQLLTATREASDTQLPGQGDAGNVNVNVTGIVDIAGEKNGYPSAISSRVETGTVGNGGNITIDSSSFSLRDRAILAASTSGLGNAGNITVSAKNAVDLANAYILSTVDAGGVGQGGNININAATLSLIDDAQLQTVTGGASDTQPAGRGDAGNINVNVTGIVDIAGEKNNRFSGIFSQVQTGTVGNGGNITIDSGSLSLQDGTQLNASTSGFGNAGNVTVRALDAVFLTGNAGILSTVEAGGVGKGGNIDINAPTLSLIDGAQLQTATREASDTQPAGQGDAGNVNVNVTVSVDIAGEKNNFFSGIRSLMETGTVGNGGNITIDSGSFSLRDGAQLLASTFGQGNAGNVTVQALDAVFLNGDVFSTVGSEGVGKGGNIDINAATLSLIDGAGLIASTLGQGNAGNVTVSARDAVDLAGNAKILTTVGAGGVGKGGNIDINAATLSLIDGAQLQTVTAGASATAPAGRGDAGNVNVNITGAVDIAGEKNGFVSGISSFVDTGTVGNGGNITIDSGSFSLQNGAGLTASTSGLGNAGTIKVNAADFFTISGKSSDFNSGLFVNSQSPTGTAGDIIVTSPRVTLDNSGALNALSGSGNGGNINLQTDLLLLRHGASITTSAGTDKTGGNGGNINIDVPSGFIVAVPSENSDITANAYTGSGGRVNIQAFGIYGIQPRSNPTSLSDITASSEFGVNGTVELNTPDIDPNSGLVNLPTVPVDTQVAQTCQAGGNLAKSSFTITGRGGLPPNPGEALNTDAVKVDLVTLNPNNERRDRSFVPSKITTPAPEPIIEATGLALNQKGEVVLTANLPTTTPHSPWLKPASCRAS
ncbi:Large exoprotein involved in heme utilization or adhesion [Nostoc flagelliforme CCNUN1]|uniref:Large exoprotein involved in heme utilization or adhesion n=1 Tax=Nostoc flagelliforme CCNUN1 TaxID=2038116 RepID=A0A2K8SXB0_9NOSO|nr:filamentous hemagglutinin N-terminal domain-containing protein [Nostoc flagelliforme]AUB40089.1 Large exoprotein involved in heme utilization or adhesion [Nostoc flagelliforme CCNUN1]